jgi:hypothetical protein
MHTDGGRLKKDWPQTAQKTQKATAPAKRLQLFEPSHFLRSLRFFAASDLRILISDSTVRIRELSARTLVCRRINWH